MIVKISFIFLWTIIILKPTSGQVNTYIETLEIEFYNMKKIKYKMDWYNPQNMSNFAKLMVCVDVWQKTENKRIMEGKYKPLTTDQRIPNLQVHNMRIKVIIEGKIILIPGEKILHCALNFIEFEKNAFLPGPEFYIMSSTDEYCVYMLFPEYNSTVEPVLRIKAEVCGLLINIKYDKTELEKEYINAINDPVEGLHQIIWDEIIQMNNENRFILCLDVYEKIARTFAYAGIVNNELPVCESISANLFLESSKQNGTAQYVMALHCPLNEIQVLKYKLPKRWTRVPSTYLAKSIRSGCVYVLGKTKPIDSNREEDEPELSAFIKAEVCGVLGSVRDDVYQLETEFSTKEQYLTETYDSASRLTYSRFDRFQLCIMIYRKLYQESLEGCKFIHHHIKYSAAIEFRTINASMKYVSCVYCPIKMMCPNAKINAFYVIDSINLGCLYVMFSAVENQRIPSLNIYHEICGVYSFHHLLQIKQRKINNAVLNLP